MAKKIFFLGFALLLAVGIVAPKMASALTLTPTSREVSLTAGQKTATTITLKNETDKAVSLTTEVVNFTAKGETGEPSFDFNATPTDIATWIEVDKGPITLQPAETMEVEVVFNTPSDATAGGHYGAVFFNEYIAGQATGQVNIESKLGTLFLATVKGDYQESGAIASFATADGKNGYGKGPIGFAVRFQNTGAIHLKPTGSIVIKNMFGKVVKTIPVNTDGGATLPHSIREYTIADWNDIGSGYGQYKATLTLTSGTVTDTATISFWIMSTTWLMVVIAVIIVLALILLMMSQRATKRMPMQQ